MHELAEENKAKFKNSRHSDTYILINCLGVLVHPHIPHVQRESLPLPSGDCISSTIAVSNFLPLIPKQGWFVLVQAPSLSPLPKLAYAPSPHPSPNNISPHSPNWAPFTLATCSLTVFLLPHALFIAIDQR